MIGPSGKPRAPTVSQLSTIPVKHLWPTGKTPTGVPVQVQHHRQRFVKSPKQSGTRSLPKSSQERPMNKMANPTVTLNYISMDEINRRNNLLLISTSRALTGRSHGFTSPIRGGKCPVPIATRRSSTVKRRSGTTGEILTGVTHLPTNIQMTSPRAPIAGRIYILNGTIAALGLGKSLSDGYIAWWAYGSEIICDPLHTSAEGTVIQHHL